VAEQDRERRGLAQRIEILAMLAAGRPQREQSLDQRRRRQPALAALDRNPLVHDQRGAAHPNASINSGTPP
jgi:hypothetical protein